MPTELVVPLTVLVYLLCGLVSVATMKLMAGHFDAKSSRVSVEPAQKVDNFYTLEAAKQQVKTAEANQRAEEARLQRVRLEKNG